MVSTSLQTCVLKSQTSPQVLQYILASCNLNWNHATSPQFTQPQRIAQPQLEKCNLNSCRATSTRIMQPQLASRNLNSNHATSAQFTQPLL